MTEANNDVPVNDKFEVLRDFALERAKQNEESAKVLNRTLIICGSKQAGKTTILNNLLDKNVAARPTLALEYSFGRKINKEGVKVTCNFWEVAGGVKFSAVIPQLIYTPLKERRWLPSVTIVVDLTRPSQIYITLDKFMKVLKDCLTNYSEKYPDHYQTIFQKRKADWKAIHPNHSDADAIDLTELRSHIIGAKYDEFQNLDPEKKKVICRLLRTYALTHGASLHFVSTLDNSLLKRAKEVLQHAAFDFIPLSPVITDYNAPLSIPAGFDTLADIGTSNFGRTFFSLRRELESWYCSHHPQVEEDGLEHEDPSSHSSFKESQLDFILQRKKRSPFI